MFTNKLAKITILILLIFALTGFTPPPKLPDQVSSNLEKISGVEFASMVLIDGKTGKTERFMHPEADEEKHTGATPATRIDRITSIFVVNVTGVDRKEIDENYQL